MFRIERSEDPEEIYRGVRRLADELERRGDPQIREVVTDWLREVLPAKGLPVFPIQYPVSPEGLGTMLADTLERWHDELLQQGRTEGRREARREAEKKGKRQGEATIVLKQLRLKFGPLDAATRRRVHRAEPHELERWAERILTAESLEEVLAAAR